MTVGSVVAREILIQLDNLTRTSVVQVAEVSLDVKMSAVGAFTVTKENIEDDRALLSKGVIGTGTEVNRTKREDLVILVGFINRQILGYHISPFYNQFRVYEINSCNQNM